MHYLPSLKALRTFEAVARLKSFKRASQELNVTPSAVSHQIRQLEEELGCRLSLRGRGGFELTSQGRKLAETVKRSFRRISETVDQLREESDSRIVLQVYSTFAVRWLLPRLPAFEAAHPEIEIRLITSQLDADLADGTADACVMIGTPDRHEVDYTLLFQSRVYPVCNPDYLKRAGSISRPKDLKGHTLLQVYPSHNDWSVWLNTVNADSVDPSGHARFDSYDHALNMAVKGMGVALAIEPFADEDVASGQLIELFPGQRVTLPGQWYFATLASRRREPKLAVFRQWLVSEMKGTRSSKRHFYRN
ncbi:LysR substrate-binding domain-containing protein [Hyphomonas beringensis]|uniref:LysR substrate-binding domain-containing protein n=1 Tax=Hyphomonas beringensis TaxID=1280946 RepID=UPI0009DDC7DC|nr:LysR substrate-binding domain-containing protein [Hyphomonas beringensis]